jgi:hypothetical protein
MNSAKRKRLEAKGFKVGGVQEFVDLSPEEAKCIELKVALAQKLQAYRNQDILLRVNLPETLYRVSREWQKWSRMILQFHWTE